MPHTGFGWQIIYWLSTPVLVVLATIFIWRRLYREFLLFFSYIVVASLGDLLRLLFLHASERTYVNIYWSSQLLNSIFALAAVYELSLKRLFPHFYKVRFYQYLFFLACSVSLVLAALTAFRTIALSVLFNIQHAFDFLRVITLFFFVALMLFMGRRWAKYEFGVALGFALDAAAFVTTFAIWTRPGLLRQFAILLPTIGYDLACIIWLAYFLRPQKPEFVAAANPELVRQARAIEGTLKDSLKGRKPPSDE